MKSTRTSIGILMAASLLLANVGCAVVGPSGIRSGRGAYTDAISTTDAQQILKLVVGLRYADMPTVLNVSSVTASMKFSSNIGTEFGIGPEANYDGNLTPLSGGVAYEENPTISYAPVRGARFIQELLSPVPLDLYLLLLESGHGELVFRMLTDHVNGISNPAFVRTARGSKDDRFDEVIKLLVSLDAAGCLDWGSADQDKNRRLMAIHNYAPKHLVQATELLELFGTTPTESGSSVVIPISLGISRSGRKGMVLQTRSVYQAMQVVAANVEVPATHAENGLALSPSDFPPGHSLLTIRSSPHYPASASVAVKHRNHWFYLEATDHRSRIAFQLLQSLLIARLSDVAGQNQRVPVLTVPVGG